MTIEFDHLTETVRNIYLFKKNNPNATHGETAEKFGISRHAVYRALKKADATLNLVESTGIAGIAFDMGLKAEHIKRGWVKGKEGSFYFSGDDEQEMAVNEQFIENIKEVFKEEYVPRAPVIQHTANSADSNLLTKYIITDLHLGMKAWEEETGQEYDLKIAERNVKETMDLMIQSTPSSAKSIIVNLGDYFHANDSKNQTPGSGHILDVDGRYAEIAKVGIRTMRNAVYTALEKHEQVEYIGIAGNHDTDQNSWLTIALAEHFENNPRVTFKHIGKSWRCIQFGQNMLAFHHGHGIKFQSLALAMAAAESTMWGNTTFRFADTGHVHHMKEQEIGGVVIRSHRAMGLRDAYSSSHLYYSGQGMTAATYHKERGEIQTNTVNFFKGRPV